MNSHLKRRFLKDSGMDLFLSLILIAFSAVTLYPMWHELCLSFSGNGGAVRGGFYFWPRDFSLSAYTKLFHSKYIWVAYKNSILVTIPATLLSLLLTSATAYPLMKKNLRGRSFIISGILFTMLFSGGMIPTYLVVKNLHLLDKLAALIIPGAVSAFNVIVMKNFFAAIPEEIEESAYMDGANPVYVFYKIILPLSLPVLVTVGLWESVANWNNFIHALIYINSKNNYTLPLTIREIISGQQLLQTDPGSNSSMTYDEAVVAATIMISLAPILCVYPFMQKYFVKGAMIGSVKG